MARPVSIFNWACWASSLPRSQVKDRRSCSGIVANLDANARRCAAKATAFDA